MSDQAPLTETPEDHSLLFRLEESLGLRHVQYLTGQQRISRVLKAVFIRPESDPEPEEFDIDHDRQIAKATHRSGVLMRIGLRILNAARQEFWIPLNDLGQSLKQRQSRWGRWMQRELNKRLQYDKTAGRLLGWAARAQAMRWIEFALLIACLWIALVVVQASLSLTGQLLFVSVSWLAVYWMRHLPKRLGNLGLMVVSTLVLARYVFWRVTQTLDLTTPTEIFLGYVLLFAESYTWIILLLGFIQTAWPLNRKPLPLPRDPNEWPTVDVFIPSYNEPLSVVRPTVYAAKGIDWPTDKMSIYILDDGRRPEFAEFAKQAGVEYMIRPDNKHAKAGNINHALKQTHADYVAIFDCDHIPTRSFLQVVMGWFLADDKCVMIQTPHHFFSADPFERNFNAFREIPNEGTLFYGLIQDGNDFWNATFFCGSCAVIKRGPLLEVGGIAVETVTEDAHTALKLHRRGYRTAYLRVVQAAGLATESLSGHVGQRIRWARGMAQIFRVDNPMFGRGLNFFQRVCYSNAMLHFFYGIPRLLFLVMPMAYLFFEMHLLNAAAISIISFVIPTLVITSYSNSAIQGDFRHSFWSEVYETVLSWYIVLPTTMAFINPKLGKFNVTAKGGLIEREYFDAGIAMPYLVLLLLNIAGFIVGILRMFIWNTHEVGSVALNMVWCFFNLVVLGAAVGVASEAVQRHVHHRVRMVIPAVLHLPGGYTIACYTEEYSAGGLGLALPDGTTLPEHMKVMVGLNRGDREFLFPALVVSRNGQSVGLRFDALSAEQEMRLIQCTFGRADAWLNWSDSVKKDAALKSLGTVTATGLNGYIRLLRWMASSVGTAFRRIASRKMLSRGRS